MCGIVAVLKRPDLDLPLETVRRAATDVAHRGPDGSGLLGLGSGAATKDPSSSRWTVGLGHRRLSIIDLSDAGLQPMSYAGDRYWLIYNGETYNYLELREELARLGHVFRSESDSEAILAAYAQWGADCFARMRGMWGLVIVDTVRNEVVLSRDRLGIKPLYIWRSTGVFAVASEIKQFLRMPGFRPEGDPAVIAEYLARGFEDPNTSFFRGVEPLPAGTFLRVSVERLKAGKPVSYWSPERVRVAVKDPRDAASLFAAKFDESVRIHRRSDVPVGCALSGGLDSSAIAGVFSAQRAGGDQPMHTFTSTFAGDPLDERAFAEEVIASVHGVPHFVTPSPQGFLDDLERFVWHHDEPVGSLSIYAAYCLARLTREAGVPVTLNGQGGDEILAGYWQSYFLYLRELALSGRFPALVSHILDSLRPMGNAALLREAPGMLRRYRARRRGETAFGLEGQGIGRADILTRALAARGQDRRIGEIRDLFLPRLLKWDDRNSMSFSVEGRYPFLDHELIELCLSFSQETLYSNGWTKWPLRLGFRDVLPARVARRKSKFGFEVPQDRWLCGPMRPALEKWLASDRPLWDLLDRSSVERLAQQTWQLAGEKSEPGQALFRCFVLDRWLDVFHVRAGAPFSVSRGRRNANAESEKALPILAAPVSGPERTATAGGG